VSSRVDQHEARKENLIKKENDHCKLLHRYQSSYGTLMCADKNKTYCVDNAVEEGKRNWLEHNPPVKFLRTNLKKFISNWSMIFSTLATLNLQILMFSHIFAMFMWLAPTQQKFAFVQGCCHACFHQQLILSLIFLKCVEEHNVWEAHCVMERRPDQPLLGNRKLLWTVLFELLKKPHRCAAWKDQSRQC